MLDATRNSTLQQMGDEQIAVSYLIGIDWTIAQQWESVRQKEKQIRELKRIVGQGVLTEVLDSAASLRSRLVVAQERLKRITTTLSSFRVHEQYHDLEREASKITRELSEIPDGAANSIAHILGNSKPRCEPRTRRPQPTSRIFMRRPGSSFHRPCVAVTRMS